MADVIIPADVASLVESLNGAAPGTEVEVPIVLTKGDDGSFSVTSIDGTPVASPEMDEEMTAEEEMMLPEDEEEAAMADEAMAEADMEAANEEEAAAMEEESSEPFARPFSDFEKQVRGGR